MKKLLATLMLCAMFVPALGVSSASAETKAQNQQVEELTSGMKKALQITDPETGDVRFDCTQPGSSCVVL